MRADPSLTSSHSHTPRTALGELGEVEAQAQLLGGALLHAHVRGRVGAAADQDHAQTRHDGTAALCHDARHLLGDLLVQRGGNRVAINEVGGCGHVGWQVGVRACVCACEAAASRRKEGTAPQRRRNVARYQAPGTNTTTFKQRYSQRLTRGA